MSNSEAPRAEILSQGDEVVTGEIADSNAAWLAERLAGFGFDLARHTCVGDDLGRLIELLREIAARAELCISTGGLGPTRDDLTAEAVARAFEAPLREDRTALQQIEAHFARRARVMPAINRKQAQLPTGARRLDNHWGTAPGFLLRAGRCLFAFLPGVPPEMTAMFEHWVEPELRRSFALHPGRLIVLRTFGAGESTLEEQLLETPLPEGVRLGFRAAYPEVQVKLRCPSGLSEEHMRRLAGEVATRLGDVVFSIEGLEPPGGDLAAVVGSLLAARKATLAVAETLSAGRLAWLCREQAAMIEAVAARDPARLCRRLRAAPADLAAQSAAALAVRLRDQAGADYALVNLGKIGPSVERPTNVEIGLAGPEGSHSVRQQAAGARERRRIQAAALSLDVLRRHLSTLR